MLPEDGGTMVLRNVGILSHLYTASRPRRPGLVASYDWRDKRALVGGSRAPEVWE
jgi:hypothetical protein